MVGHKLSEFAPTVISASTARTPEVRISNLITMEVRAYTKNVRMSPKKVRQVAREIQGMEASRAMNTLKFIHVSQLASSVRHYSLPWLTENNGTTLTLMISLYLKLSSKKGVQCAVHSLGRGSAHPIRKRSCHIRLLFQNNQPIRT